MTAPEGPAGPPATSRDTTTFLAGIWPFSYARRALAGSKIRRGLYFSSCEAMVAAGMFVFTEAWLIPILQKQLHAPAWVIGLIATLPQVAIIVSGPFIKQIARWLGGNRATALVGTWIQALCILALSVPLHFPDTAWALPLAVSLAVIHGLVGVITGAGWVAWMGGLIPKAVGGRYNGNRMTLFVACKLGFAALFTAIVVATDVDQQVGVWGLQALVVLGAASRFASWRLMLRQPDLPPRPRPRGPESLRSGAEHVGILGFIANITRNDLGRWTLVWASLQVGAASMGPFIAYYMVLDAPKGGLGLSGQSNWWSYTVLLFTSQITRLLSYPAAGRLVDRFGAATCLRLAVWGILLVPLTWIFSTNWWILFLGEVFSGMCWCTAEIAVGALLFGCHRDPERRSELIGCHAAVVGVGVTAGLLLGTVGSTSLPALVGSPFQTLFLLSMILRLPAAVLAFYLLPRLRPLHGDDHHHFLDLIPGVHLTRQVGRGLSGVFSRPD